MVERVSTATAYTTSTGTAAAGFLGLGLSDWALIVGMACAVGTFGLNWYYKQRALRLRQKEVAEGIKRSIFTDSQL